MVWIFVCFELPGLSALALLISKGEESSGSNLSTLIPNSDLLLMMPQQLLKNRYDLSRTKCWRRAVAGIDFSRRSRRHRPMIPAEAPRLRDRHRPPSRTSLRV